MNITCARLIYFSPTRTTKKILEGIAQGLGFKTVAAVDLTLPGIETASSDKILDELVLIGAPVYSGRVPPLAAERIGRFKACQTPAVVVVVYGNRAFEDALLELRNITTASRFRPIAGAVFIGEHSFANAATPIAFGRPDRSDLEKARRFGERLRIKVEAMTSVAAIPSLQVPGKYPYKERRKRPPASPLTREDICTKCGQCATVCPTNAVTVGDTVITDPAACVNCFACIKSCPTGARRMEDPGVLESAKRLYETCSTRQEPEIFGV